MNIELLIDEMRNRPILWDIRLKEYRFILQKNKAWDAVVILLHSTVDAVKQKWKYLRNMYVKCKQSGASGSAGGSKKKWAYYDDMSFLNDVVTPKSSDGSWEPQELEATEPTITLEDAGDLYDESEVLYLPESPPNAKHPETPTYNSTGTSKKRKRQSSPGTTHKDFQNAIVNSLAAAEPLDDQDDIQRFLLSQHTAIKSMPFRIQEKTKLEIQQVVFNNINFTEYNI